jgi:cell division protein FtsB
MRDRPRRPAGPRGRSRPRGSAAATRPVTRRPSTGSGAATRTSAPRPPSRLTSRAVILGVVLLALAMSYVFPLRIYLTQQAEISELRVSHQAQREHIAGLEAEADRWADDEYVRIQARKRRFFVEPGEIPIIIVWDEEETGDAGGDPDDGPQRAEPWWSTLWSSVEAADEDTADRTGDVPQTTPPAGE